MSDENDERSVLRVAALYHDIGKFRLRAGEGQNHWEPGEKFLRELNQKMAAELVLRHHDSDPRERLGAILKKADQLSASERIPDDEEKNPRAEPLVSILSTVHRSINEGYAFERLMELDFSHPRPPTLRKLPEAQYNLQPDYRKLWELFSREAGNLPTQNQDVWLLSSLYLLEKYTSFIPASVYKDFADIPLYDHLRTTCAFADAFYVSDSPPLLVKGDIPGIQRFIYSISEEKALKSVQGRSMFIILLTDAIARYFVRRLELTPASIVMAGGGHFELVAPGNSEEILKSACLEVRRWLFDDYDGALSLAMAVEPLPKDLKIPMAETRRRLEEKLADAKQRLADGLAPEVFEPFGGSSKRCAICSGERDVQPFKEEASDADSPTEAAAEGEKEYCRPCQDFIGLGKRSRDAKEIYVIHLKEGEIPSNLRHWQAALARMGFIYTFDRSEVEQYKQHGALIEELAVNRTDFLPPGPLKEFPPKAYGFVVFPAISKAKSVEDYAKKARGVSRWALLKGDVDSAGALFRDGLRNRLGLTPAAALSRALSHFFGPVLGEMVRERCNIFLIYSGGDDFLLGGSWNDVVGIVPDIWSAFEKWAGGNPHVTLSMGLCIPPDVHYPFRLAVAEATDALDNQAKKRDKKGRKKDAIGILGGVVGREEWDSLVELKKLIGSCIGIEPERSEEAKARAFLFKMGAVADEYRAALARAGGDESKSKRDGRYNRWKWLLAYILAKNGLKEKGDAIRSHLDKNINLLAFVVRLLEMETRGKEYKGE